MPLSETQHTPQEGTYSTTSAGRYLRVHPDTVLRWAKAGLLAHTVLPSGRLRFTQADLDAALDRREKQSA